MLHDQTIIEESSLMETIVNIIETKNVEQNDDNHDTSYFIHRQQSCIVHASYYVSWKKYEKNSAVRKNSC